MHCMSRLSALAATMWGAQGMIMASLLQRAFVPIS